METLEEKYRRVVDELDNGYAAFHKVGAKAYDPGLGTTRTLASRLGNPQDAFRCIHVGGTNGKGSTAHTLAAILGEAGYKVGLYTSPHILDFRERIRVDGKMIEKEAVIDFMERFRELKGAIVPSYFELLTLMAFDYFVRCKVDVAVIEVGLGGRLDSTNIIHPELSIITNISLDHTALLGNTEEAIAAEKAGIIKPGVPAVIGRAEGAVRKVFADKAMQEGAPIYFAGDYEMFTSAVSDGTHIVYESTEWGIIYGELCGDCQIENTATIMTAVDVLQNESFHIPAEAVRRGFENVCELTGLMGRWMHLAHRPEIICDTGHNIGGWRYLGPALRELAAKGTLHVVLGFVSDKDVDSIMAELPREASYYFATPGVDRAREASSTAAVAAAHGIKGCAFPSVKEALENALSATSPDDTVFIGGSTFVVADALSALTHSFDAPR